MSKICKSLKCYVWLCVAIGSLWAAQSLDELEYDQSLDGVRVEAIISYKLELRDSIPVGERYRVSRVMRPKPSVPAFACSIDVGDYDITDDMAFFIIALLKREKEQVLECLYSHEVLLRDENLWRDSAVRHYALLEIPAVRVYAHLHNKDLVLEVLKDVK
ncbi:hypothetical protein [uncultured Helicobacter sp.]|uniref:hypothetical protein n=1 Tax=uncultured Helicobacter sp. TaxID=175537 RepID=UPI00374F62EA